MSERNDKKKGPYGRPAPHRQDGERRYGKPATPRPPQDGERRYGKPASPRPPQDGERRYGKPASPRSSQDGERRYGKPASPRPPQDGERRFKPVSPARRRMGSAAMASPPRLARSRTESGAMASPPALAAGMVNAAGKPASPRPPQDGERRYGKPASPRPQQDGERRYGKPASPRPPQDGERRFDRPASPRPFSPRPFERSGDRPFGDRRPGIPQRPAFKRPGAPRPGGPRPGGFRPAPARPEVSTNARKSALFVLNRVLIESGYASLSLDEHFEQVHLAPRDKRLCTRLVYLTLENLNRLDFALSRLLQDPLALEPRVRNLLRLSAAQIMLLDRVPDSAAVDEAVKLTRAMGLEDLTGLVNGVLRNLIRTQADIPWPTPEDGLRYYNIMFSQPEWFARMVLDEYGEQEGGRILSYEHTDHRLTLRPNLGRISPEKFRELLAKKEWQAEPGLMPDAWLVSGVGDIARDSDFLDGLFSVQGQGSMVAAEAVSPKLGAQVLDTCAAPGGKSAYMAEKMQGTGRVQAWDIYEHRVSLIKALADRLRLYNIRPAVRDALVYREQMDGMMDAVLIDAPCTGTGVLHEKPDLRIRLSEDSLRELMETQRRLLDTCSRYVKPGGTLVYATCSILPDENAKQVEGFLITHPDFQMAPLPDTIPEALRGREGLRGLQLLPHRDGVEGFYIARMQRR